MYSDQPCDRRAFLKSYGFAAVGCAISGVLHATSPSVEVPAVICLKSWEIVEIPSLQGKRKRVLKITASNGAFGLSRLLNDSTDLYAARQAVGEANLLDHDAVYNLMAAANVPLSQLAMFDIACWDLHARMLDKPLHVLLGTRRKAVLRYGDVRGTQPEFSPEKYAASLARSFERTGMKATKLHFPGCMGTPDSISFKDVLETLKQVRAAVGSDKILAWDPYPRSAESATPSLDEAREILALMDDLGYSWIEGPLLPTPFETQIPKYVELMRTARTKQRVQAEGPNSPIGDGTSFEVMKQWVEAGAVNQCSTDVYLAGGVTNAIRMLEYARKYPGRKIVINLHWAWAPHAHLAMAYDDAVLPIVEFPMVEEIPREYTDATHLLAPDWPGIYKIN